MTNFNFLLSSLFGGCMGQQAADGSQASGGGTSWWVIIIYIVIFGALIYFMAIRPQRKQRKAQEERMSAIEPGDSVMTTSGFYGKVISISGDTVVVEFGNNKNCRIPMAKGAISQVEKANAVVGQAAPAEGTKKLFGRKKNEGAITEADAPEEVVEEIKETVEVAEAEAEDIKADVAEAEAVVEEAAEKAEEAVSSSEE